MYTTVKVQCRDQALQVMAPKLAAGGVNEIKMEFFFCPLWDGFGKTAVFFRDGVEPIKRLIGADNTCIVPWEMEETPGAVHFGVFGSLDGVVRTTEVAALKLLQGPPREGAAPEEPTPDIYEQILSDLSKAVTIDIPAAALDDIEVVEVPSDPGGGSVGNAVLYDAQTLTDEQQAQARENIGAASAEDMESAARTAAEAGTAAGEAKNTANAASTAAGEAKTAAGEAKTAANEAKQAATNNVTTHNTNTAAHADIRTELKALADRINAVLDSDDETLDEWNELVAYIKSNKSLIDAITISKVNVSDIVDNLVTNVANKPLSASQGVALKALVDAVSGSLANYQPKGNYLTSFTETDPTVPSWAKQTTKPKYTASEVGALPASTTIPTKVSQLTNDRGYLTQHQDISGKLDASALPEAVNTALAQAKASGEFDGADGRGIKSIVRTAGNGAAGTTDTYTITYTDNTTSTITVYNGKDGTPGKTPAKGTDYWTAADQEAIVQQVIAALGTPVFGRVDASNNIILTGELVDGTYTVKYEDADGKVTEIGTLVQSPDAPNYTNQIPISVDTDGSVFNGTGYQSGKRFNSSYAIVDIATTDASNPVFITGLIKVKSGDVVRFKNCHIDTNNVDKSAVYGNANWSFRCTMYKDLTNTTDKSYFVWTDLASDNGWVKNAVLSGGLCTEYTVGDNFSKSGYNYVRLCLAPTGSPADAIVTINEEII